MVIPNALQDPLTYALPFFIVFMALEIVSLGVLAETDRSATAASSSATAARASSPASARWWSTARPGCSRWSATPRCSRSPRCGSTPTAGTPGCSSCSMVDLSGTSTTARRTACGSCGPVTRRTTTASYFNLTTAVRQKWNPWFELLFWVPLPLLGVPPWLIFTAFSINLIFQFFVHTERVDRLPAPIEFVFNTPSHHRVHHASDADYLDKNFAGILIIWDRLFGSYAEETHRPTYGLTKNYDTQQPVPAAVPRVRRSAGATCVEAPERGEAGGAVRPARAGGAPAIEERALARVTVMWTPVVT